MSVRIRYGKTWWGEAWINALERIDYDANRLPRGRTYANTGRVKDIKISGKGNVEALVQGSRPKLYKITIKISKFSASEKTSIKKIIEDNPSIASELSLGNLPSKLLEILEANHISIMPKSWRSIDANCSCPDWANPCKHLAAVYYIIANEIDKNPFLIFKMKGIPPEDLSEGSEQQETIPEQRSMLHPDKFIKPSKAPLKVSGDDIKNIDLTFPPQDINSLFALLKDSPLFYPYGNFNEILRKKYSDLSKYSGLINIIEDDSSQMMETDYYLVISKEGNKKNPPGNSSGGLMDASMGFISITDQRSSKAQSKPPAAGALTVKIPSVNAERSPSRARKAVPIAEYDLVDYFIRRPLTISPDKASPSAAYLSLASSIALALVRSFSFIPEIISSENGRFSISYVPLIHDEKINKALKLLESIRPVNFIFRQKDSAVYNGDPGEYIVSVFLTHIVFIFTWQLEADLVRTADKIYKAFFFDAGFVPSKFEETNTAKAIKDWTETISIRTKSISPLIRIDTLKNESFTISLEIENKKDPMAAPEPFEKLFDSSNKIFTASSESIRMDVLRQAKIAASYLPELDKVINSKGKLAGQIDSQAMFGFLTGKAGILKMLGINIIIPKGLRNISSPRIILKGTGKKSVSSVSYLSLDKLLSFDWRVSIGDVEISKEEFLSLIKSAEGIIKFRDEYLILNPDEVKNILKKIQDAASGLSPAEALQTILTGQYDGIPFIADEAIEKIINNLLKAEDIDIPSELNATLRQYQVRGYRWLYSNLVKGLGSCLADDMGLGKTIQVISLLLKLKKEGQLKNPALVVCPTTLLGNWFKECGNFAPSLKTFIYHGQGRKLNTKGIDLVITTYGTLRSDIRKLEAEEWACLIIDEAQNIKNPESDQSHAVKNIKARGFIALSGTPVENRLSELWSIFDFLNRGFLGSLSYYKKQFATPIEKYRDKESIDCLRKLTSPFILRRLKTDKTIINDLPDKIIFDEYCYLSREQTALYEQTVKASLKSIEGIEGINRKGLILKLITSLKQICNHPAHYLKTGRPEIEYSGKSEKLIELLTKILANGEKALLFTQYKEMGMLLEKMIGGSLSEIPLFFHGGVPRAKRDKMVAAFQEDRNTRLMIISLKAGGTGLNLTEASNVIHYDLWWNPAVEAQATDRAYRIGQMKNVTVHRLITLGTFEEKIDEMIKQKKELADLTITAGENWITELSDKGLRELFSIKK
ncbi:MAG TPA: SNF2-related protein [Ignavibacteriales bacterium]|nr:SNF2-related protein [Ignavibacteriales bacterium]